MTSDLGGFVSDGLLGLGLKVVGFRVILPVFFLFGMSYRRSLDGAEMLFF